MDEHGDFTFESVVLWLLVGVVLFLMLALGFTQARAQDAEPAICRDTTYPTLRFQVRDIPAAWFAIGVWYLADGANFEGSTWIADALTDYPPNEEGIIAGMVIFGTLDYAHELRGDSNTLPCDESTPMSESTPCPAMAINAATGAPYCYTPQVNGLVPLPHAGA